ncbi:H-type lectin domain-containing protein, partial [Elusimicrobiota bacterium]
NILEVADNGNIGIGTANPIRRLHMSRDGSRLLVNPRYDDVDLVHSVRMLAQKEADDSPIRLVLEGSLIRLKGRVKSSETFQAGTNPRNTTTGIATVTFDPPFSDVPTVMAIQNGGAHNCTVKVTNVTATGFKARTRHAYDDAEYCLHGVADDGKISWIAILD